MLTGSGGARRLARSNGPRRKVALQPGLSRKIRQLLKESHLPKATQVPYLCAETGRKKQTVYRWIQATKPGNPDLESFVMICLLFQVDANWILGLTPTRYDLPVIDPVDEEAPRADQKATTHAYVEDVAREVELLAPDLERMRMTGDEMEPKIRQGALLFVNPTIHTIQGNGIYVLTYQGQRIVRQVEQRIGEGLALLCENKSYKEVMVGEADQMAELGLTVLGKVSTWLQLASV